MANGVNDYNILNQEHVRITNSTTVHYRHSINVSTKELSSHKADGTHVES